MTKAVWGAGIRLAGAAAIVLATTSCGDMSLQGTSSSFLIINTLEGASGAAPSELAGDLRSDVITVVNDRPTFFNDIGQVEFALALKDPGSPASPTTPSQNNFITIDRYRVTYFRTDGRNTPGVDVPYAFDSAFTVTVSGTASAGFTLVRNQAKQEAPLLALSTNGILISTIAEVTFYGHDQTGRSVTATGRIGITFGNFGDPAGGEGEEDGQ
jgi:hypothetical protein